MGPSSSLFAVLTLIVAPAVLTNASSVLALNTANRFGRVIDRSRAIGAELIGLAKDAPLYEIRLRQLKRLRLRGELLIRAQSAIYGALGAFVLTALLAVVGAAFSREATPRLLGGIALGLGVAATSCLFYGCALIVRETRLALVGLRDDIAPFGDLPAA
jgi:hypothetical protein